MEAVQYGKKRVVAKADNRLAFIDPGYDAEHTRCTYLDDGEEFIIRTEDYEKLGQPVFNYGDALQLMRLGYRVARLGWNGKGMWLGLVEHWSCAPGTNLPPDYECLPFIAMKTADDKIVPWLCSQTDALAVDYVVVYA